MVQNGGTTCKAKSEVAGFCLTLQLYWMVLCVNLTQAGLITEKGVSAGEVPP